MSPFCAVLAIAAAQDFGTEWIDRVTLELQGERTTLESKAPAFAASTGLFGYYDSNVFLEEKARADFILIPFVQGRFDYVASTFDLAADLLVDYRYYFREARARDSEQRLFLRARTTQPRFSLEIAEILRHESEPVDIVFLDRSERVVSNTLLRGSVDVTEVVGLEADADLEIVRFLESEFDHLDNFNYRANAALVLRLQHEMQLLVQLGYLDVAYEEDRDDGAPPDGRGYVARAGFRGELTSRLALEAWAGYAVAEPDERDASTDSTVDLALHLRYEATERWTFLLDATRRFEFAGGPDALAVVNRALASAEFQATREISVRARLQWEQTSPSEGGGRDYWSASVLASWKPSERMVIDGGATHRRGERSSGVDFDGVVLHVGVAITY